MPMSEVRSWAVGFRLVGVLALSTPAVARADVVLDWSVIAADTFLQNATPPFNAARNEAVVQLAVFEAVNAITGDYTPYLGTVSAPDGASAEAAAVAAAYRVLRAPHRAGSRGGAGCRPCRVSRIPSLMGRPRKTASLWVRRRRRT